MMNKSSTFQFAKLICASPTYSQNIHLQPTLVRCFNTSSEKLYKIRKNDLNKAKEAKASGRPKIQLSNLSNILVETIKTTGPLSLSGYMKTCLTHPEFGYYTTKDPLGVSSEGDFVTSPEISQMFGEMIGLWFYSVCLAQSVSEKIQFIEFGPGKGTLMFDLLRSFNRLFAKQKNCDPATITVVLVEASPILRQQQFELLCDASKSSLQKANNGIGYVATSKWNNVVRWVDTEKDIDELGHSNHSNFVVCHEFFDALPIKQFVKTSEGWRECLVDYMVPEEHLQKERENKLSLPSQTVLKSSDFQSKDSEEYKFHITYAPKKTTSAYLPEKSPRHNKLPEGSRVEISTETLMYAKKIQEIITSNQQSKGAALFIDYGPADTIPINTLRGIKNHKIVSPFINPGSVDLSADVDFQGIKHLLENQSSKDSKVAVDVYGPVEQGDWLNQMGIAYRANQLIAMAKDSVQQEKIYRSCVRLVDKGPNGMGKIYKFMGIVPKDSREPVGFGGSVPE